MGGLRRGATSSVLVRIGALEGFDVTNDESSALVIGTPVYLDALAGVKKARANSATSKDVFGLMVPVSTLPSAVGLCAIGGVLTATTSQWDTVTGGGGGLAANAKYYLDPATAGMLTLTAPSAVGQYVVEIGIGISWTDLKIGIRRPILL